MKVAAAGVELRRADGSTARLPARELAAVELSRGPLLPPDARYDELELTDGSTVRAAKVQVKGTRVAAEPLAVSGLPAPAVELPLRAVSWLMRGGHDPKNRQEWATVLAGRGKRDQLVSRTSAGLQAVQGTLVEGTPAGDRITFEVAATNTRSTLPLTRASGGLVFNQPPADNPPPAVCRVSDAFGNTWVAAAVELAGDGLTLTTPAGAKVSYPDRSAVRLLDFGRGNVAYLSDLPLEPDYPPAEKLGPLADQFPYSPRLSLDAGLRLAGRAFDKGLAVPPEVAVGVPVGEGFRTFRAVVGLAESAPADAALAVRIDADGRPLFDGTVRAGDPPRELSLNVADARRLRISVGRGPLWVGSPLVLGDPRFQK